MEYSIVFWISMKILMRTANLNLKIRLKQLGLDLENVSSYSADNTNVNFGIYHSVYQLILKDNSNVYSSRCVVYMLHNAVKFAIDKCKFDIEKLVLKIYDYFSYHAKRVELFF